MKKFLLSLSVLSLALSLSAADCIQNDGWSDNFDASAVPVNSVNDKLSVVYWGDANVYTQTRSGNGSLDLSVTQAQGGWTPMGFDLGETTNYVDVSGNLTVSTSITNNGPSGIEVYFGFISGRTTGSAAKTVSGGATGAPFGGPIASGATQVFTFDLTGAKKRTWVADQDACDALGGTLFGNSCMTDVGFDPTELSTGEFSINGQASAESGWAQPAINDHAVSVDYIKGGATCTDTGVATATCSDGIQNQDETGVDCGGATCSPCGGGGTGTSCAGTIEDDGQAQATFYKLLENGTSDKVTCSFDALGDIKGTFYGALETRTLQGSGTYPNFSTPTKYCGMCVEMTGLNGTATVQVVDECPDCHEHNSGDTDIDLSPQAFSAIVGAESVGRSNITWKEISCPWTAPIEVIVQGSNWSYAKVIIAKHVNRIDKVEIGLGGSNFQTMVRGIDNGWIKSFSGGSASNHLVDIKVTDIYGGVQTVSGISLLANPTNSTTVGTGNFAKCTVTGTEKVNTLDYISAYPNPANNSITFEGLVGVNSIEIYSTVGNIVGSQVLNGSIEQASVDLSGLTSGLYIAKFTTSTGVATKTFVKK